MGRPPLIDRQVDRRTRLETLPFHKLRMRVVKSTCDRRLQMFSAHGQNVAKVYSAMSIQNSDGVFTLNVCVSVNGRVTHFITVKTTENV